MTTIDQAAATYFATLPSIPSDSTRQAFRAGFEARAALPIEQEMPAPVAVATSDAERSALIDLVEERLTAVYHCTRVWEAWQVGTMTEDDFVEARGTDLAPDIADAVLARRKTQSPALPIDFKQATDQGGWQPIATAPQNTPIRLYAQGGGFYDEDFNPSGSVEGQWTDGTWCGAFWDPVHDTWFRRDDIVPTHWMPLPKGPDHA